MPAISRVCLVVMLTAVWWRTGGAAGEQGGRLSLPGVRSTTPLLAVRPAFGGSVDRALREALRSVPPEQRETFRERYAAYLDERQGISRLIFLENQPFSADMASRRSEYKKLVHPMSSHQALMALGPAALPLVAALPEKERPQGRFLFLDILEALHPHFVVVLSRPGHAVDSYGAFWLQNRAYLEQLAREKEPDKVPADELEKRIVWPGQIILDTGIPECSVS